MGAPIVSRGASIDRSRRVTGRGVDSGDARRQRTQRRRLHRLGRAHADRQVRRRPGRRAGDDARRHRHPRRGGARRRGPCDRAHRRGLHGPGPAGRRWAGAGAPGAAQGGPAGHDPRDDHQPRLWLGPEGDHARGGGDPRGRRRGRRGRRHGEHEPGPVPAAEGALRLPPGQRRAGRLDRPRRPLVRDRGLPHGHARRARGDQRVACREPTRTPSRSRATSGRSLPSTRAASRTRSCRCRFARGREERARDDRRGPATRHDRRGARQAQARLRPARPARTPRRDGPGTVTAGNAPGITDGAAATVVASERAVERSGLQPARPDRRLRPGRGRAQVALPGARSRASRSCSRGSRCPSRPSTWSRSTRRSPPRSSPTGASSGFDWDRRSTSTAARSRSAIPSARAARASSTTLLHELRRREGRYGLATLCLGGGGSVAMAFERV